MEESSMGSRGPHQAVVLMIMIMTDTDKNYIIINNVVIYNNNH
jgi:hypothetical protein